MESVDTFSDFMKKVVIRTSHFVLNDILCPFSNWIKNQLLLVTLYSVILIRILIAVLLRLICGIWVKFINVVPFQICEKNNYYEDPGVLEMRSLLKGEDLIDSNLEQQQKLPFPPPEYDPYDKIYLAAYFYRLQRYVQNFHGFLTASNISVCRRIGNFSLFSRFIRYLSSHVAVNMS